MTRAVSSYDVVPTCALAHADDISRATIKAAFTELGILVTIEATDANALLELAAARPPSLAIIDVDLPTGGLNAARRLTLEVPETSVVLVASHAGDDQMFDALSAGAVGYLPADVPPARLAAAAVAVLDGEVALTRSMMARVVEELQGRPGRRVKTLTAPATKLTSREWDVASLMRSGASTQQIAARLYMSSSTVRVHVSNILHKLHVSDRETAIRVLAGI